MDRNTGTPGGGESQTQNDATAERRTASTTGGQQAQSPRPPGGGTIPWRGGKQPWIMYGYPGSRD